MQDPEIALQFLRPTSRHPSIQWRSPTGKFVFFDSARPQGAIPPELIVNVGKMIKDWEEELAKQRLNRRSLRPEGGKWTVEIARQSLEQMREDIDANPQKAPWQPIHLFGLAFREPSTDKFSPESVLALATVQFLSVWDGNDRQWSSWYAPDPGQSFEVVHVNDLASTPNEGIVGSPEREMLKKIIVWAKLQGKIVTVDPANVAMQEYYKGLGFEFISTADGDRMFYPRDSSSWLGDAPELATNGLLVDLVTLKSDSN